MMQKVYFSVMLIFSMCCQAVVGVHFQNPGSEIQGELKEAEGNGAKAGLHGANADCASNSNVVGAKEGPVFAKLKDASKKISSSHRSSTQDRKDDQAMEEAMNSPCEFGVVESPPEALPPRPECVPDWSAPCPKGWQVEGQSFCRAGEEYEGDCDVVQDLGGFVLEQKKAFARICKVIFPCQSECEKDWESCPNEWQEVAPSVCLAPESYIGGCDGMLELEGMIAKDKALFESVCAASWPCSFTSPQPDYTEVCADGWTLKSGVMCEAPSTYNGPCGKTMAVAIGKQGKKDIEDKCSVSWPLHAACSRNYGHPCPAGWLSNNNGDCQAPSSYNGACQTTISFASYSPTEKENWALSCDAPFPCAVH